MKLKGKITIEPGWLYPDHPTTLTEKEVHSHITDHLTDGPVTPSDHCALIGEFEIGCIGG